MTRMNKKMAIQLENIKLRGGILPAQLTDLLAQGFCKINDCFFLSSLATKKTIASNTDFPDKTGYECFINSIHIDDYTSSDYLANAHLFAELAFRIWHKEGQKGTLQAIISSDEFGASIKFHFLREGESWIDSDLSKYEDAILVLNSDDLMDNLNSTLCGSRRATCSRAAP